MSEKSSGKQEMNSVEFTQDALQSFVAPPSIGSVKERITHAARKLRWAVSRTTDAWYAEPSIRISADEMRDIEELTGLRYARQELRTNEHIIARAQALLDGADEGFYSAFVTALVALARPSDRSGIEG